MRGKFVVSGIKEARLIFQKLEGRTVKAMQEEMTKAAKETAEIARAMAPFEFHDLEESIQVVPPNEGSKQRFRIQVIAGGPVKSGMDVSQYAAIIHENWESMAFLEETLERAARKQRHNGGYRVGGKFLERALDEVDSGAEERFYHVFRRIGGYDEE